MTYWTPLIPIPDEDYSLSVNTMLAALCLHKIVFQLVVPVTPAWRGIVVTGCQASLSDRVTIEPVVPVTAHKRASASLARVWPLRFDPSEPLLSLAVITVTFYLYGKFWKLFVWPGGQWVGVLSMGEDTRRRAAQTDTLGGCKVPGHPRDHIVTP